MQIKSLKYRRSPLLAVEITEHEAQFASATRSKDNLSQMRKGFLGCLKLKVFPILLRENRRKENDPKRFRPLTPNPSESRANKELAESVFYCLRLQLGC